MDEPRPATPTRSRPKDLAIVGAIVCAGALLLIAADRYLAQLGARAVAGEWETATTTMRHLLMAGSALVALSTLALGAMLWRVGTQAIAQGHFPPPGHGITAAHEREGDAARKTGRMLRIGGVLIALAGLAAAAMGILFLAKF